ncbi:MAG: hypothetical protein HYS53_01955 [Candidatus Aenigmarchaeota archaeon]|nr:hypothetical protein [Candidatus Aenigmarchaeota archaeon]
MGPAYSSAENKGDKNYVTAEQKENKLVEGLIVARPNGYAVAIGYKKPRTRAPRTKGIYGRKQKRVFVPTQCKFCGAAVAYGTVSKSRLRAAGSTWIDTCDSCSANPDVAKDAKIYV